MIPLPPTMFGAQCFYNPNADTLNPCDRTIGVGLTAANLTASAVVTPPTVGEGIRAIKRRSSGKYYFEFTIGGNGNATQLGLATKAATLGTNPVDACYIQGVGALLTVTCDGTNHGTTSTLGGLPNAGVVGIAVDLGGLLFWAKNWNYTGNPEQGQWNLALNGNPATGTGGVDLSVLTSGTLYPLIGMRNAANGGAVGSMATFNPTSTTAHTAPSGFTAGW